MNMGVGREGVFWEPVGAGGFLRGLAFSQMRNKSKFTSSQNIIKQSASVFALCNPVSSL